MLSQGLPSSSDGHRCRPRTSPLRASEGFTTSQPIPPHVQGGLCLRGPSEKEELPPPGGRAEVGNPVRTRECKLQAGSARGQRTFVKESFSQPRSLAPLGARPQLRRGRGGQDPPLQVTRPHILTLCRSSVSLGMSWVTLLGSRCSSTLTTGMAPGWGGSPGSWAPSSGARDRVSATTRVLWRDAGLGGILPGRRTGRPPPRERAWWAEAPGPGRTRRDCRQGPPRRGIWGLKGEEGFARRPATSSRESRD